MSANFFWPFIGWFIHCNLLWKCYKHYFAVKSRLIRRENFDFLRGFSEKYSNGPGIVIKYDSLINGGTFISSFEISDKKIQVS